MRQIHLHTSSDVVTVDNLCWVNSNQLVWLTIWSNWISCTKAFAIRVEDRPPYGLVSISSKFASVCITISHKLALCVHTHESFLRFRELMSVYSAVNPHVRSPHTTWWSSNLFVCAMETTYAIFLLRNYANTPIFACEINQSMCTHFYWFIGEF